jgi:hypothetical protein
MPHSLRKQRRRLQQHLRCALAKRVGGEKSFRTKYKPSHNALRTALVELRSWASAKKAVFVMKMAVKMPVARWKSKNGMQAPLKQKQACSGY